MRPIQGVSWLWFVYGFICENIARYDVWIFVINLLVYRFKNVKDAFSPRARTCVCASRAVCSRTTTLTVTASERTTSRSRSIGLSTQASSHTRETVCFRDPHSNTARLKISSVLIIGIREKSSCCIERLWSISSEIKAHCIMRIPSYSTGYCACFNSRVNVDTSNVSRPG